MINKTDPPELEFSGERFTPECVREMAYEHWHRYALASTLVQGRRVLDAACGEGYGSALLADSAASVDGIDLSDQAVDHARRRYQHSNLSFTKASVTRIPFPDRAFDVIVSFETLEHLKEQSAMLGEFSRLLADDGFLLISSPDKAQYSDATGYNNEFHVRELYRDELMALLSQHFSAVRLLGQVMAFQSLIWPLDADTDRRGSQTLTLGDSGLSAGEQPAQPPLYFLALCAARSSNLPAVPAQSGFSDDTQSVYAHYQHEIRKNMAAGEIIAERDAEISRLTRLLEASGVSQADDGESHGV